MVPDEFGPEMIVQVFDHATGLRGFTVIDNTALGPAKGGIRMTPTVSIDEVASLARTMTWKCSLAGLPFGGGKSGIVADPRALTPQQKHNIMAAFGRALRPIAPKRYVAAPDMNTAEEEMRTFAEANGSWKSCTGKPANLCVKPGEQCGIPHEYGSTGFGVFHATLVALQHLGLEPAGRTFAIEGYGNVGSFAAKYLTEKGLKLVAISDSRGCIFNPEGIDVKKLEEVKKATGSVTGYEPGTKLPPEAVFEAQADILIPAAIPDSINEQNWDRIKARLIVEAANIPATPEIERRLHEKGVLVVPDFVANAGGVISSYAEYRGKNPEYMFKLVEEKIVKNTRLVLKRARREHVLPRDAAMAIAVERVRKAMEKRAAGHAQPSTEPVQNNRPEPVVQQATAAPSGAAQPGA